MSVIVFVLGGDRELFGTGVGGDGIGVVAFARVWIAGRISFISECGQLARRTRPRPASL
jgi:hypothetical protein